MLSTPYHDKTILGVFAHPDDETSSCASTFSRYVGLGATVHVITATGGELGTLGTGDLAIERADLPLIREQELRTVLAMYGAQPPTMLGYRDQELAQANPSEVVQSILAVMRDIRPDAVVTFGPTGISRHDDHIAIHRFSTAALDRYEAEVPAPPRLFYPAIPKDIAAKFELDIEGPEFEPNVFVDSDGFREIKVRGLRAYRSQQDAQQLAGMVEENAFPHESFHLARPGLPSGAALDGLFSPL